MILLQSVLTPRYSFKVRQNSERFGPGTGSQGEIRSLIALVPNRLRRISTRTCRSRVLHEENPVTARWVGVELELELLNHDPIPY